MYNLNNVPKCLNESVLSLVITLFFFCSFIKGYIWNICVHLCKNVFNSFSGDFNSIKICNIDSSSMHHLHKYFPLTSLFFLSMGSGYSQTLWLKAFSISSLFLNIWVNWQILHFLFLWGTLICLFLSIHCYHHLSS